MAEMSFEDRGEFVDTSILVRGRRTQEDIPLDVGPAWTIAGQPGIRVSQTTATSGGNVIKSEGHLFRQTPVGDSAA